MNAQLLPCPFCGEPPTVRPWHGGGPLKRMIYCENDACGAEPSVTASTIGRATAAWNTRAALAAPKEAGGGDYLRVMRNLEREYPMDAKVIAAYIARLHDGIRRLAAPSKEAGSEGLHPTHTVERAKRALGVAAPQADQQGAKNVEVSGVDPCRGHGIPTGPDQQGASLEGEAVVWVQLEDGKPVALSFTRNEAAGCTTPFTASKPSPDDQRQEASPPTEAAASDVIDFKARAGREAFQRHPFTLPGSVPVAGTFDEIERELRDLGAGNEPMTWGYLHARMNALADQLAALSPTASAAREGSNGR